MSDQKIDVSGTYFIKLLLITGGVLTLLYMGSTIILPLIVAIIIAMLLNTPTVKKLRLPLL